MKKCLKKIDYHSKIYLYPLDTSDKLSSLRLLYKGPLLYHGQVISDPATGKFIAMTNDYNKSYENWYINKSVNSPWLESLKVIPRTEKSSPYYKYYKYACIVIYNIHTKHLFKKIKHRKEI
jgi:hypothetical protein